ncbi:MAG: class II fructose-bisphosphatase [Anaerolineales bacterium]|nr:class II fructose-bisphosphatase [Chloroflexota bacterium]MBL7162281.1 class II fructose-bisphosphatase [Anaerolineales bacterium]
MANSQPSRNLALELVRVTESAALASGRFMGRGQKEAADKAAVDAMRLVLNSIEMDAVVVIGEGEKDKAPMLFNGEKLGNGEPPAVDIAVDPIDGTRPLANGFINSISTVAIAPRGTMYDPGPFMYMHKLAVGPEAVGMIDINAPVDVNLGRIARIKNMHVNDLTVVILDRPRHDELIQQVRECGARIRLIPDGDVAGAMMTCWPDAGVDVLMGIGGTPEGVLAACALRGMGGEIQGKLYARNEDELARGVEMGYDFEANLTIDDLVSSDDVFFAATGITDGALLDGVKYFSHGAMTDSIVIRGLTGSVREMTARHNFDKLNPISQVEY